jgi:hypothetical protein
MATTELLLCCLENTQVRSFCRCGAALVRPAQPAHLRASRRTQRVAAAMRPVQCGTERKAATGDR